MVLIPCEAYAGSWTKPDSIPTASEFVSGQTYYIFNVGKKKFLTEGNDWGTRASLSSTGLKFTITQQSDGTYQFKDYSIVKNGWYLMFIDGSGNCYVDGNTGRGHYSWLIYKGENMEYKISCDTNDVTYGKALHPDCYLGWGSAEEDSIVSPLLDMSIENSVGYCIKWYLISEDTYNMYQTKWSFYNALNEAETLGLSVTDYVSVYSNSESTLSQMTASLSALQTAIKNKKNAGIFDNATPDNPADITSYITNPTFTINGSGWTGSPSVSDAVCECGWNKNFDIHQTITGLPDGLYKLSCQGFYRDGDVDPSIAARKSGEQLNAFLYAGNDSVAIQSIYDGATETNIGTSEAKSTSYGYVPYRKADAKAWFAAGYYDANELFTGLYDGSGSLTIGVKKTLLVDKDWTVVDNFRLLYYGKSADAYKTLLKSIIASSSSRASSTTILMSNALRDSLKSEIVKAQAIYDNTSAVYSDVMDEYKALQSLNNDITTSVDLYSQLGSSITSAASVVDAYPATSDSLSTYLEDIQQKHDDGNLSNAECSDAISKIKDLIDLTKNSAISIGDCTSLISDPSFDNSGSGWTFSAGQSVKNSEVEYYKKTFDMNQTIKGLPNGKYTLKCQGFFRTDAVYKDYNSYMAGKTTNNCMLYANNKTTNIVDIMAEQQDVQIHSSDSITPGATYVPNTMAGARTWFDSEYYDKDSVSVVVTDNILKLGVKLSDVTGYGEYWALVDNFRLSYQGASAEVLKDEITSLVSSAASLNDSIMSSTAKSALTSAVSDASSTTLNSIQIIRNLNKAIAGANASVVSYHSLLNAIVDVDTTAAKVSGTASSLATFKATRDEVYNNYKNGAYEDSTLNVPIQKLYDALRGYTMADINATKNNPADVTSFIINPNMTKGQTGWTNAGDVSWSEMQCYNKNINVYQTITGIKNGYYKVSVQGFYRDGARDVADTLRQKGQESLNAYLYANNDSVALMSIFECAGDTALFGTAEQAGTASYDYLSSFGYVPFTMQGASFYMTAGRYVDNTVLTNVTDNKITIGVKKNTLVPIDWTLFSNFKLYYLGDATSVNSISENGSVVSTSYYNANGIRYNKAQRGLNIVKSVMSNGKVSVSKMIK